MNSDLTEIAYILDRSGSMSVTKEAAIAGFNDFLAAQQKAPGRAHLSLVLFDNEHLVPYNRLRIDRVPPLDARTYVPRGSTALLDSIGITIDAIGRKLAALPEDERPGQVIIAIFTDGYENASTKYTIADINKRITHQQEKYGWEFLFLGANQDAIATAASMGISANRAATYADSLLGKRRSSKIVSDHVLEARRRRFRGETTPQQEKSLQERYSSDD